MLTSTEKTGKGKGKHGFV